MFMMSSGGLTAADHVSGQATPSCPALLVVWSAALDGKTREEA
jgi:hypothetical protein